MFEAGKIALTSYKSFHLLGDPQTLFSLENMRAARIPYIIIFLQKVSKFAVDSALGHSF